MRKNSLSAARYKLEGAKFTPSPPQPHPAPTLRLELPLPPYHAHSRIGIPSSKTCLVERQLQQNSVCRLNCETTIVDDDATRRAIVPEVNIRRGWRNREVGILVIVKLGAIVEIHLVLCVVYERSIVVNDHATAKVEVGTTVRPE
jgi:hypothetical protein